jgi:hypothetical protein
MNTHLEQATLLLRFLPLVFTLLGFYPLAFACEALVFTFWAFALWFLPFG